ncbi:MAG: hypothetical protein KY464_12225 [Gemmatimonadetes bacterium]|nr:hypothetical protein [Gemmatimonadota bacterium]
MPEGIRVEVKHFDDGPSVTFVAFSGDERDERAFLHFVAAPESFTEARGRVFVQQAAESYRIPGASTQVHPVPPPSWAVVKYPIMSRGTRGAPITGWVALGQHNGRFFHILLQQPQWAEKRVAGQMQQILDTWRWADDGTPLQSDAR